MSEEALSPRTSTMPCGVGVLLLAFALTCCSPLISPPSQPEPSIDTTDAPPPTRTVSNPPTLPPQPPSTSTPTNPPLTVQALNLFDTGREGNVQFAIWLDDNRVAVAFTPRNPLGPEAEMTLAARPADSYSPPALEWLEYDTTDRVVTAASSPILYDPSFWQRNKLDPVAAHPELDGYFSPSGRLVIYIVRHGGSFDLEGYTEVRVAATDGSFSAALHRSPAPIYVSQVAWSEDESRAIYDAGYEGPVDLFVADIHAHQAVPIQDVTDFDSPTESSFALAPNGKTLAAIHIDGAPALINMANGTTQYIDEGYCSFPAWSPDGQTLYYWCGPEWGTATELRAYHVSDGRSVALFDIEDLRTAASAAQLEANLIEEDFFWPSSFAPSPDGDQFVLWEFGHLPWLLTLENAGA